MSEKSASEFLELARAVALHAYAVAAEANLFDEFEFVDECSNHLWDFEGHPILATVWYALSPELRETAPMRSAASRVMILFLDTFDERPDYGPEQLAEDFVARFSVSDGGRQIDGPLVYNPMAARRAEDERPFTPHRARRSGAP